VRVFLYPNVARMVFFKEEIFPVKGKFWLGKG
jgi:hypothetical protein